MGSETFCQSGPVVIIGIRIWIPIRTHDSNPDQMKGVHVHKKLSQNKIIGKNLPTKKIV